MTSTRRATELARISVLAPGKPPANIELLTPKEVARALRVDEKTLSEWRYRNLHLRYYKIGNAVRYRVDDVVALLEQSIQDTGRYYSPRTRQALHRHLEEVLEELAAENCHESSRLTAFVLRASRDPNRAVGRVGLEPTTFL